MGSKQCIGTPLYNKSYSTDHVYCLTDTVCLCDGLLTYTSLLMSSIGFSIFDYFCRLGYCGVHLFINTSFAV